MRTDKELLDLLTEWNVSYFNLTQACDELEAALGCDLIESQLYESAYKMFEQYTKTLANLIAETSNKLSGDVLEWLEWYAYENQMGKEELEAKAGSWKRQRKISDLKILLKVMLDKK